MSSRPHLQFAHMGIYVRDMEKMYDFYTRVLGFHVSDEGINRGNRLVFLTRDANEHHQIVLAQGRPDETGFSVINQISFRTGSLDDLKTMKSLLESEGIAEFRQVTHGNAWSIYFADPEDNRIEIFVDTPWHIDQPSGEPIDLAESTEAITAATEAHVRTQPGYGSMADWRRGLAKTLEDAAS
jgi:catechol 2,3-dioxygenase